MNPTGNKNTNAVACDPAIEAAVVHGLERAPEVQIPADFAMRVVASLPPAVAARKRAGLAPRVSAGALVVLCVALFALAPHAAPSFANLAFDLEMLLLVQIAGLGYMLLAPPQR